MLPFNVDPKWYEEYWLSERPRPKRRSFSASLARFAVLAALIIGGGALLSHYGQYNAGDHVGGNAPASHLM